jgi:hypothetical protein
MSAQKFLADVENGVVAVDSHEKVLWIAFIYMDEGLWLGNGAFDVIEKLHAHGWSFGEGELRLNRSVAIPTLMTLHYGRRLTVTNTAPWICSTWPRSQQLSTALLT